MTSATNPHRFLTSRPSIDDYGRFLILMRLFLTAALIVLAACGDRLGVSASGGSPSPVAKTEAPRPTGFAVSCHADYAEHYTALETLVDRADLVVGGVVTDVGAAPIQSGAPLGNMRQITLRSSWLMKAPRPLATINVLETPCPLYDTRSGDEWIVFLSRYWGPGVPSEAGYYIPIGGVQSVFIARDGVILRPREPREAPVVAAYAGKRPGDLQVDVGRIRPVDGDARALFERYGWRTTSTFLIQELTLPTDAGAIRNGLERPLSSYSAVSSRIGLDLRPYLGRDAELLQITLERERDPGEMRIPPIGYTVIVDRKVVGAWVLLYPQRDIYAVDERDAALAAPPRAAPSRTPVPNRFPQGVNLARRYELATATSADVRFVDGRSPDTSAAELAAALDLTLATDTPPADAVRGYTWIVQFSWSRRLEPFEYDIATNTLVHRIDGFAVHPPPAFRAILDRARR